MRKKIKELMNKEEGFTLVELLAVIVILGIIVAIAIPAIGSVIDRAREDSKTAEASLVEDAARLYITTSNPLDITWASGTGTEGTTKVYVGDLDEAGLLDEREDTTALVGGVTVTRDETEADSGIYSYEYEYDAELIDPTL